MLKSLKVLCLFVLSLKGMQKYLHMQLPLSLMSVPHKHQRRDGNWVRSVISKGLSMGVQCLKEKRY